MEDDRITCLPEHVKHHILSFLPSIKEVVRTSSLSKSWLETWGSLQIPDFNYWLFAPNVVLTGCGCREGVRESFIRFVDDALMRSRDGIPRFRLDAGSEMGPHIDRWVAVALDNHVEELSVNVLNIFYRPDSLTYLIPERVLSAESIKSLTLTGDVKIDGISPLSMPSLRSLSLEYADINDKMFRRLLGSCRLLEDLSVVCCGSLSAIEVANLDYLKSVRVAGSLKVVSIKASSLERFCFSSDYPPEKDLNLVVRECPKLRFLEFGDGCVTDEWFCQFLSKFPLLESLIISRCRSWKRIWISNPLLKKIVLENCNNLVYIRIDTPKLSSFYYEARCHTRYTALPSVWSEHPFYSCAVGFTLFFVEDPIGHWLPKLQKFLARWFTTFRCLESTVHLYEWDAETEEEMDKKLVTLSTPTIQHLKLKFMASESEMGYYDILDGLFSICHPSTILLKANYPLRKFICEMLANWEESPKYGSPGAECWRHELKDVKIDRVEGAQHQGPLDWCALFSLLPTLPPYNGVCFRLQW